MAKAGDSPSHFPLPTALKRALPTDYVRLGHPALVGGKAARIGGEIFCKLDKTQPRWYISNGSGRYGVALKRTEEQLANVAEEFAKLGIDLKVEFYE
jgi:hypothetical protein